MDLLNQIVKGSSVCVLEKTYKVLSKVLYATQNDPNSIYAKMILEGHNILVVSPVDKVAYFGKNEGKIPVFDGYKETVEYNKKVFAKANHDYQVVLKIDFGNPLETEGEVEFWDYEADDDIISVAVVSRTKKRADVVAKYILYENITVC